LIVESVEMSDVNNKREIFRVVDVGKRESLCVEVKGGGMGVGVGG